MSILRLPRVLLRDPDRFGGRPEGDVQRGTAIIRDGCLVGLTDPGGDAPGSLILPGLTEAHCHLDKCHTIDRLGPVGGDLARAIAAQRADKTHWTRADLTRRMQRGLREAAMAGCTLLRSHIDWGEDTDPPLAWHVLHDLAPGAGLTVQAAALTSLDLMADPAYARTTIARIAADRGVPGSFVHGHDSLGPALTNMIREAERHGLPLDFHVDEGLGPLNGLETIADAVLETGFQGPVLCGHAVSLIDRSPDHAARITDKLARAGIFVCALPTTNLYLQGRTEGTPDRRGLTRLRELHAAGVRVLVGSDNVGDAFCPLGQHDPMAALHLAILAAHLDPPLDRWLPLITTNARAALGQPAGFLDGAPTRDLLQSDAASLADLIAGRQPLHPYSE